MDRIAVLLVVLLLTGVVAAWWRARDGRVTAAAPRAGGGTPTAADVAAAVAPTTPLVLVEFTAPDCASCARTKVLLDAAAATRDDLSVVAIDVADGVGLARAHGIMRAPTTLLLSADGHLLGRVAGVPRPGQLAALLDDARCSA